MALEAGKYLSLDMCNFIEQWTDVEERKEISINNDCSYELCRIILKRERKLTDNNLSLITDIIAKAVENRKDRIKADAKTNKKALNLI